MTVPESRGAPQVKRRRVATNTHRRALLAPRNTGTQAFKLGLTLSDRRLEAFQRHRALVFGLCHEVIRPEGTKAPHAEAPSTIAPRKPSIGPFELAAAVNVIKHGASGVFEPAPRIDEDRHAVVGEALN